MKTATVRELRNHYSQLMKWISAGEEIAITRRGETVARLVPEKKRAAGKVDWTTSAAFRRDRSGERILSAKESLALIKDAGGKW